MTALKVKPDVFKCPIVEAKSPSTICNEVETNFSAELIDYTDAATNRGFVYRGEISHIMVKAESLTWPPSDDLFIGNSRKYTCYLQCVRGKLNVTGKEAIGLFACAFKRVRQVHASSNLSTF